MTAIDVHAHLGTDLLFYLTGGYPYALDLPQLVADGRRNGLERWVVFPMVTHTALSLPGLQAGKIEEPALGVPASIPYAWENRRLLQEVFQIFPDLGRQTLPFLMVDPARAPEKQVEELNTLRTGHRIHGLKIQATIIQSPIRELLRAGRCLLDFAEKENLPVLIHTSVHPADRWSQVADILEIARSRPSIRFCLAHSCRFDRAALDEVSALPNTWFDSSAHVIACRLAVQDHPAVAAPDRRFPSDYRDPSQVLAHLARAYPDRLMWGSDAPFHSYASPGGGELLNLICSYDDEARPLRELPEDDRARITYRNTLAFLGLKELPA